MIDLKKADGMLPPQFMAFPCKIRRSNFDTAVFQIELRNGADHAGRANLCFVWGPNDQQLTESGPEDYQTLSGEVDDQTLIGKVVVVVHVKDENGDIALVGLPDGTFAIVQASLIVPRPPRSLS